MGGIGISRGGMIRYFCKGGVWDGMGYEYVGSFFAIDRTYKEFVQHQCLWSFRHVPEAIHDCMKSLRYI